MKKFALLFTVATVFAISCENKTEEVAPEATPVEETVVDTTAAVAADTTAVAADTAAAHK